MRLACYGVCLLAVIYCAWIRDREADAMLRPSRKFTYAHTGGDWVGVYISTKYTLQPSVNEM